MISESGGTSLLPIVVSYYSRVLRYNSLDVGLTFLVAVFAAIPGAIVNAKLCHKFNPKISLRINFCFVFAITIAGAFVLTRENPPYLGYIWGVMWGFSLGWMYSGEQLFYTLCMPASQEAEFAGFFVYCTVILTWLPSLIYSAIVERGFKEQYGLGSLCGLQLIAMFTIAMVPDWDHVIEGSKQVLVDMTPEADEGSSTGTTKEVEAGKASTLTDATRRSTDSANETDEVKSPV
jgi:MFS-type transporter involved in bile tolerance (Atg22 family)